MTLVAVASCLTVAATVAGIVLVNRPAPEYTALVEAIQQRPGELYMFGGYPQVYISAGREPDRRFFYNVPLIVSKQAFEETVSGLRSCSPELVVVDNKPDAEWAPIAQRADIDRLYARRQSFGDFDLLTDPAQSCTR